MSDKPKDEQTLNSGNPADDNPAVAEEKTDQAPAAERDETVEDIPVEQTEHGSEVIAVEEVIEKPEGEPSKPQAPAADSDSATKPDTSTKEPSAKPANQGPDAHAPAAAQRSGKGIWLLVALLILGWAGTGYGGYWLYQQQLQGKSDDQALAEQIERAVADVRAQTANAKSQQAAALEKAHTTMQQDIKAAGREAARDFTQLQAALKEHEARLNGQQQHLASLTSTSREDWLLAEAEYLLKLANQRILLEQTPENVLALLQRADDIIEQASAGLGDRELFAIRKRLAEHITALKLIKPVDTQGTYLRLGALASSIGSLPTLPTQEERFNQSEQTLATTDGWWSDLKTEFKKVMAFFAGAFHFRDEDELANPIVSQQRLQLMQLNTRLLIEQAQIALLKHDQTTYQEALTAAADLTEQYYFESPARKTFAAELRAAAGQAIAVDLPDISGALKQLHAYTETLHRLNPSDTQASGAQ